MQRVAGFGGLELKRVYFFTAVSSQGTVKLEPLFLKSLLRYRYTAGLLRHRRVLVVLGRLGCLGSGHRL